MRARGAVAPAEKEPAGGNVARNGPLGLEQTLEHHRKTDYVGTTPAGERVKGTVDVKRSRDDHRRTIEQRSRNSIPKPIMCAIDDMMSTVWSSSSLIWRIA